MPAFITSNGLNFHLFSAGFGLEKMVFSFDSQDLIIPQNRLFFLFAVCFSERDDYGEKQTENGDFVRSWGRSEKSKRVLLREKSVVTLFSGISLANAG